MALGSLPADRYEITLLLNLNLKAIVAVHFLEEAQGATGDAVRYGDMLGFEIVLLCLRISPNECT